MSKSPPVVQSLRAWIEISTRRSMREWMRFAKSTGLSMPQFSILMQLHHKGVCGVSEISEKFDVTAAAASQLVEKLAQSGYLDRAEDPRDRRAKQLRLTQNGEQLILDGIRERYLWVEELAAALSAEERKKVIAALDILTEKAKQVGD